MRIEFDLPLPKFFRVLYFTSFGFLAASLAVSFWCLFGAGDDWWFVAHNFDFDEKNNLPHAFKSLLLVFCSVAIFLNARAQAAVQGDFLKHWRVLGWIFLALAVDEEVQIHQKTVALCVAQFLHLDENNTPNSKLLWVVPYLFFAACFCLAYVKFWWKLPSQVRARFAIAGIVYVGGAAFVEEIAHKCAIYWGNANVPYLFLTNFSEFMQMIGSILFLQALALFYALRTLSAPLTPASK